MIQSKFKSRFSAVLAVGLTVSAFSGCASTSKGDSMVHHVKIEGDHLIIDEHINFGTNSDEIQASSNELIDEMATLLKANTTAIPKMKIVGHTDNTGDSAHNHDLSKRRADAVAAALTARGAPQELETSGAGEDDLLCQETTPECHEMNRRVEFIIVTGE